MHKLDACSDGPFGGNGGGFYNVTSENAFVVGFRSFECLLYQAFFGAFGGINVKLSDGSQVQGKYAHSIIYNLADT